MADSGGSTSSSSPWWKSLTRKKSKEVTVGAQPHVQPEAKDHSPPYSDRTSSSRENQHSDILGDTGEPPRSDNLCEEKSGNSRRNLKISRSGRFKEKRKKFKGRRLWKGLWRKRKVNTMDEKGPYRMSKLTSFASDLLQRNVESA
ncbi:hypothetical protein A6R68_13383 [Neotoma lepida]|uniref:Proline-rich protein 15 n=1 Tax=Neotoma lepida TaxID=56216 RepID=A0A1A6H0Y5_NEOLE|nr:hypothetical protein A6R68_13383 [Neotoma lepida]